MKRIINRYIQKYLGKDRIVDFVIVGVCKGGTEAAIANMGLHKDIFISKRELNFFNREYVHGIDNYKRNFDYRKKFVGEKTPHYYLHEDAIARMKELTPDVKLILMIRDPVKRFFSHWNMMKNHCADYVNGTNKYSHNDYPEYVNWMKRFLDADGNFMSIEEVISRNLLVKEGFYIDYIEMIHKYFPEDQLYIAISERLRKNIEEEYLKMFEFIGAKPIAIPYKTGVHAGKYDQPMSETEKDLLRNIYRPYNERLFEYLGYEITEWDDDR